LGDDYCIALRSEFGLVASLDYWWSTWSGDLVSIFWYTLLVGLPLLNFPIQFVSSVALVVALLLTGFVGSLMVSRSFQRPPSWRRLSTFKLALIAFPAFSTSWVAFFWIPVDEDPNFSLGLAVSSTMWPTVIAAHVIPALLAVTFLVMIACINRTWIFILAALGGLFVGLSGLALALTVSLSLVGWITLTIIFRLDLGAFARRRLWAAGVMLLALATSGLIAATSPGVRSRSSEQLQASSPPVILNEVFPETFARIVNSTVSLASLITLLVFLVLGMFLAQAGLVRRSHTQGRIILILLLLVTASSFSNALSDVLVYQAVWHQVVPFTMSYLFTAYLGVVMGTVLVEMGLSPSIQAPLVVLAALAIISTITAINGFGGVAAERLQQWGSGAAPLGGISDIEQPDMGDCWTEVRVRAPQLMDARSA